MPYNANSHYVFSLKNEDLKRRRDQRSKLYLGKLRCVEKKGTYVLYDSGLSADERSGSGSGEAYDSVAEASAARRNTDAKDTLNSGTLYRKELCMIRYNYTQRPLRNNELGLEVCIPKQNLAELADQYTEATPVLGFSDRSAKLAKEGGVPESFVEPFCRIMKEKKQNEMYASVGYMMHEKMSRYDALSSCLVDFKVTRFDMRWTLIRSLPCLPFFFIYFNI
jgi:hypothetical protein